MPGWTIQDDIGSSESTEWTAETPLEAGPESRAWSTKTSILNPNVSAQKFGAAGFGGWAAEEFAELPEDCNINPEDVQADADEWTIVLSDPE